MAMLIQDDYVRCKCGSAVVVEEKMYTLKKHPTKAADYQAMKYGNRWRCSKCGETVLEITNQDDIVLVRY